MTATSILKIKLTREQEMHLLAATGLLVGSLELDVAAVTDEEIPTATIPEPTDEMAAWEDGSEEQSR